ncbi:MAG: hypothetical protein QNJ33_01675 [Crocosphaera sp.]|nr:hypothetical protein [Crocosphaera sp.]
MNFILALSSKRSATQPINIKDKNKLCWVSSLNLTYKIGDRTKNEILAITEKT